MAMDSLVLDKVSPIRRPLEMRTSLVAMAFLAGVLSCAGHEASAPDIVYLTSYPQSATEGVEVTLTCTTTQSGGLIVVIWYRNNVEIFQTNSDADIHTSILNPATNSNEYRAVSGRVTVSSSSQQHNVTLRINSTLDKGSVWKCKSGNRFSNKVTVEITNNSEAHSVTMPNSAICSTTLTTGVRHTGSTTTVLITMDQTESTKKRKFIYVVAGSVGGVVVVVVIVVASFISVLLVRKWKKDVAKSNSQMYSTMSRDPDTDNNYSELGPGLTSKTLPTSQPVTTEESVAYYNTVPADSQYENPPASTKKTDFLYSE